MLYIANAFSINMLNGPSAVQFMPLTKDAAASLVANAEIIYGCIGHKETAGIVAKDLQLRLELFDRRSIRLDGVQDRILVAQYTGVRLPEGATSLPEGALITYWLVTVG